MGCGGGVRVRGVKGRKHTLRQFNDSVNQHCCSAGYSHVANCPYRLLLLRVCFRVCQYHILYYIRVSFVSSLNSSSFIFLYLYLLCLLSIELRLFFFLTFIIAADEWQLTPPLFFYFLQMFDVTFSPALTLIFICLPVVKMDTPAVVPLLQWTRKMNY